MKRRELKRRWRKADATARYNGGSQEADKLVVLAVDDIVYCLQGSQWDQSFPHKRCTLVISGGFATRRLLHRGQLSGCINGNLMLQAESQFPSPLATLFVVQGLQELQELQGREANNQWENKRPCAFPSIIHTELRIIHTVIYSARLASIATVTYHGGKKSQKVIG